MHLDIVKVTRLWQPSICRIATGKGIYGKPCGFPANWRLTTLDKNENTRDCCERHIVKGIRVLDRLYETSAEDQKRLNEYIGL